jgi:hypothetical protein
MIVSYVNFGHRKGTYTGRTVMHNPSTISVELVVLLIHRPFLTSHN